MTEIASSAIIVSFAYGLIAETSAGAEHHRGIEGKVQVVREGGGPARTDMLRLMPFAERRSAVPVAWHAAAVISTVTAKAADAGEESPTEG
jgi:hypothetical protein